MKLSTLLLVCFSWLRVEGVTSEWEAQFADHEEARSSQHDTARQHGYSFVRIARQPIKNANNTFWLHCSRMETIKKPPAWMEYSKKNAARFCAKELNEQDRYTKCPTRQCATRGYGARQSTSYTDKSGYEVQSLWTVLAHAYSWTSAIWNNSPMCVSCGKRKSIVTKTSYPSSLHLHNSYSDNDRLEISTVNVNNLMCMVKDAERSRCDLPWFHNEIRLTSHPMPSTHDLTKPRKTTIILKLNDTVQDPPTRQKDVIHAIENEKVKPSNFDTKLCLLLWLRNQTASGCNVVHLHYVMLDSNRCHFDWTVTEKDTVDLTNIYADTQPTSGQTFFLHILLAYKHQCCTADFKSKKSPVQQFTSHSQHSFIYFMTCKTLVPDLTVEAHTDIHDYFIISSYWQHKFIYYMVCCKDDGIESTRVPSSVIEDDTDRRLPESPSSFQYAFIYLMRCSKIRGGEGLNSDAEFVGKAIKLRIPTYWQMQFIVMLMEKPRISAGSSNQTDRATLSMVGTNVQNKFLYFIQQPSMDSFRGMDAIKLKGTSDRLNTISVVGTNVQNIFLYLIGRPELPIDSFNYGEEHFTSDTKHHHTASTLDTTVLWQHLFIYLLKRKERDMQWTSSSNMDTIIDVRINLDTLLPLESSLKKDPAESSFMQMKFLWLLRNIPGRALTKDRAVELEGNVHLPDFLMNISLESPTDVVPSIEESFQDWDISLPWSQPRFSGHVDPVKLPQFTVMILLLYILLRMILHPWRWETATSAADQLDPSCRPGNHLRVIRPQFYEIETVVAVIDISPGDLYEMIQRRDRKY